MEKNIDLAIASQTTNGGRNLNAIWKSGLPPFQKLILQYFASQLDFRGNFRESRWIPIKHICENTSISERTIFRLLKNLEENGYIEKSKRFKNKIQLPNSYRLTDKIFNNYYNFLTHCHSDTTHPDTVTPPSCHDDTTPMPPCHDPGDTVAYRTPSLPPSKNPSLSPSFSADAKKAEKIKEKEIRKAVAALSLIYKPIDGSNRFWDLATVRECAEVALEKYGMEAIIALRDDAIRDEVCGTASFEQMHVLKMIAQRIKRQPML